MPAQLGDTPLSPVSLRLDPERLKVFEKIIASAGLSTAEAVRQALDHVIVEFNRVDVSDIRVEWEFTPKPTAGVTKPFPELIGNLRLRITPPTAISVERMHQLIYVLPEFFDSRGVEEFRVDNAHFHRIASDQKFVDSKKARKRAVLSFRLIQGQWAGSVFDYEGVGQERVVKETVEAMVASITATIKCDLIGQLPASRILSESELEELNEVLMPYLIREWNPDTTNGYHSPIGSNAAGQAI